MIFVTEFVSLGKNLPFYEVSENNFLHGGILEYFLCQMRFDSGNDV